MLDRSGRQIRLTEVGRSLHARALRILDELEEAEAEIAAHRNVPAGMLRVGCSAEIASIVLADTLHEFLERYPEIDFRLRVGDRLIPEPGSLDIVLHAGWLQDCWLIERKLFTIPTVLVGSRSYFAKRGLPIRPEQLAEHSIIGSFYIDRAVNEIGRLPAHVPVLELKRGRDRFAVPTWRRFMSTDQTTLLGLVRRGIAIAPIATLRIADELASGELVHVLPGYDIASPPVLSAVYTERAAVSPKLQVFIDFVVDVVARLQRQVGAD